MSSDPGLTPRQAAINARFAFTGCIVAQTGVQLVAPSLPLMRDDLLLSNSQLGLVMGIYLLPAAMGAIPAGMLADRIGRRRVFGWSYIVFGAIGVLLQLATTSFGMFLVLRFAQGLAFAGLLPLTMTILGDAFRGSDLIRVQGRRSVAMLVGDGTLPMLGGVLASITWRAPWLGQLLAIPFGIAVLIKLTDPPALAVKARGAAFLSGLAQAFQTRAIIAMQYASFLRMFLKFSILTFLPVLLLDVRDFSPAEAGLVVGGSALIGIIPSLAAGRLAVLGRPTTFVAIGILGEAMALAVWGLFGAPIAIFFAAIIFGLADGLAGVFVNSIVAATPKTEHRASFIAATGALRNFAKFLGPVTVGLLILAMSLPSTFVAMAVLTLLSVLLVVPLRGLDSRLQDVGGRDPSPGESQAADQDEEANQPSDAPIPGAP
jgi:ACDE family multidrug resistance protein